MDIRLESWKESVYAALSHFHASKAFDLNSQDIARHLEYPLYEISSNLKTESAHVEEVTFDVWEDSAPSLHALRTPRFRARLRSLVHRMFRTLKIRNS
ncbi:hypothetical protein C8R44DRAFT_722859 [Mycena epipterygia]|nr:hypothetical protein C8R44DRAFT_722859 [Mycena epipterygia]